jgi:hypothetical protein
LKLGIADSTARHEEVLYTKRALRNVDAVDHDAAQHRQLSTWQAGRHCWLDLLNHADKVDLVEKAIHAEQHSDVLVGQAIT